jgi:uncharacterized damage-inducible protein DinB
MTYYGAKEMADSFRLVRKNTLVLAEEIGEEHYGFQASPETRTIGETLVHISNISLLAEKIHKIEHLSSLAQFDFMGFIGPIMADEKTPRPKAEILATLQERGERFGAWLETLSDEFLAEQVELPPGAVPPAKSRFAMLIAVKEHEMHHRGQLMLLARMVGVVPHLTREMQTRMAAMAAAAAQR